MKFKRFISLCMSTVMLITTSNLVYAEDVIEDLSNVVTVSEEETEETEEIEEETITGPIHNGAKKSPLTYTDSVGDDSVIAYSEEDTTDEDYFKGTSEEEYYMAPFTSVKNQYNVINNTDSDNCWIFSALAATESKLLKDGEGVYDLSEEHVRQSLMGGELNVNNEYRYLHAPNTGGFFDMVIDYWMRGQYYGLAEETTSLPFMSSDKDKLEDENIAVDILDYYPESVISLSELNGNVNDLEIKNRISEIKNLIRENGNVVISYETSVATNQKVANEKEETSSIYSQSSYLPDDSSYVTTNHAVEVVGWDDNYSKENFVCTPEHNGAFIVKNSYGNNYSYSIPSPADGFIYISYDQTKGFMEIRSINSLTDRSDYICENNVLGRTHEAILSSGSNFIVNKFDNEEYIFLNKVSVDLMDTGTFFKVYISSTGDFQDFKEVALKTTDNITYNSTSQYYESDYAGIFVLDLETYCLIEGSDFLVGIEYNNTSNVRVPIENFYDEYTKPVIEEGYSYLLNADTVDYTTITDENNYIDYGENYNADFCIKAYGVEAEYGDIIQTLTGGSYNFNENYARLNTSYSNITKDGRFIANGTEETPMKSTSGNVVYGNNTYTGWCTIDGRNDGLNIGSFINTLQFKLSSNSEIIVTTNTNSGTGKINLLNAKGEKVDSVDVDSTIKQVRLRYNGATDWVYLSYSSSNTSNSLNLYEINITDFSSYTTGDAHNFWDFSDYIDSEGSYTSGEFFVDSDNNEIYIAGSSEIPMYAEFGSNTYNGVNYTKCIKLSNTGDFYNGSIHLYNVPTNSYIYILAKIPDSYSYGSLKICDTYGVEVGEVGINDTLRMYRFYYTGPQENLYITQSWGSIRLYGIGIHARTYTETYIDKEWDFDSYKYYGLNSISENTIIDGLEFYASEDYKMYFKNSNVTIDNREHRRYLAMEGSYQSSGRQLAFDVNTNCNIKIIAKSSGTDSRQLYVTDGCNYLFDTITVTSECAEYVVSMSDYYGVETPYSYIGNGDTIYLRSSSGGINIYSIKLENNTDASYIAYSTESISEALGDEVLSGTAVEDTLVSSATVEVVDDNDNNNSIDLSQVEIISLEDAVEIIETTDIETTMYYDQLDVYEKNIYDKLAESFCVNKCTADLTDINIDFDSLEYSVDNVEYIQKLFRTAMSAFINDHPEVFWLNNEYNCYVKKITYNDIEYISKAGCIIKRLKTGFSTETFTNNAITNLSNEVASIIENMESYTFRFNSDYLKLEYIFDDLVTNSSYIIADTSTTRNLHNSYGTLYSNYGSCTGLTKAFKLVCDELGYNCIFARVLTSNGKAHACNLVELEGVWYVCDLALAIDNDDYVEDYFMVPLFNGYTYTNPTIYTNTLYDLLYPQDLSNLYYYSAGDVDFDGQITANDASVVLSYVLNSSGVTQRILLNGDMDNDGVLTANDSAIIINMVNTSGVSMLLSDNVKSNSITIEELLDGVNNINISRGLSTIDMNTLNDLLEEQEVVI